MPWARLVDNWVGQSHRCWATTCHQNFDQNPGRRDMSCRREEDICPEEETQQGTTQTPPPPESRSCWATFWTS